MVDYLSTLTLHRSTGFSSLTQPEDGCHRWIESLNQMGTTLQDIKDVMFSVIPAQAEIQNATLDSRLALE